MENDRPRKGDRPPPTSPCPGIATAVMWWVRARLPACRAQRGQGLVEYALIFLLIAIICVILVAAIGSQVRNDYSNVTNSYPP